MKIGCDVIRDLLPLYHDGVCSEESKNLVEGHIAVCADCKDVLHELKEETPQDDMEAVHTLATIGKAWRKSNKKAMIKGLFIATMGCIILVIAVLGLTCWHGIPVDSEHLQVVQVAQLFNGRIACKLGVLDDKDGFGYYKYTLTEDGKLYMTPLRSIITRRNIWQYAVIQINPENLSGIPGIPLGSKACAIYLGTPEDYHLIWEEGMNLPTVTEEEFYEN